MPPSPTTERQRQIIADLHTNGPALESTIAKRTGIRFARVRATCNVMLRDCTIRINDEGKFEPT